MRNAALRKEHPDDLRIHGRVPILKKKRERKSRDPTRKAPRPGGRLNH